MGIRGRLTWDARSIINCQRPLSVQAGALVQYPLLPIREINWSFWKIHFGHIEKFDLYQSNERSRSRYYIVTRVTTTIHQLYLSQDKDLITLQAAVHGDHGAPLCHVQHISIYCCQWRIVRTALAWHDLCKFLGVNSYTACAKCKSSRALSMEIWRKERTKSPVMIYYDSCCTYILRGVGHMVSLGSADGTGQGCLNQHHCQPFQSILPRKRETTIRRR